MTDFYHDNKSLLPLDRMDYQQFFAMISELKKDIHDIRQEVERLAKEKKETKELDQTPTLRNMKHQKHQETNPMAIPEIFTSTEVMQWLKISKRTLQKYRDTGKIPFKRFNGRIYYERNAIERLMTRETNTYKKEFERCPGDAINM